MKDTIIDKKLECCSVMSAMKISDYLELVEKVYEKKGGIQGQREALKQKTAITIRNRMIKDIIEGTILPPVVIGIIVSTEIYKKFEYNELKEQDYGQQYLNSVISEIDDSNISIIDGMQRTTAILNAIEKEINVKDNYIRVEFWISTSINSLIYRMLVLNTGQVPWNIRRQIEIVFGGVINTIKQTIPEIRIMEIDENKRRKKGGEYNADSIIEMFLAFGARTWKIDTREKLTDEFTRGDFVQSSSETDIVDAFCKILELMFQIDILLDKKISKDNAIEGKYSIGRDLFSSGPAKIGFAAACGISILGRPGIERNSEEIGLKLTVVENALHNVIEELNRTTDVISYVDFSTLSQLTDKKTSKIGDYERELFYSAFKTMIEEDGKFEKLTVCWRSA